MGIFVRKFFFVWLILIPLVRGAEPYFAEIPPLGFDNRNRIDEPFDFYNFYIDCPQIHYSNWKPSMDQTSNAPEISYAEPLKNDTFGGVRAFSGEFLHMAAIGWTINGKIKYMCGGTLITSKFVLTAAHCSAPSPPDTVRLGDTHLESTEDDEYAQQIKIRAFKRHPNHRFKSTYFDIALIELEADVKFTEAVIPACLWLEKKFPSEEMQSIGFGATESAYYSPTLQKVTLSKIGEKECIEQFSEGRKFSNGIVSHQFCAGSSSMDTCQGDSGGPIQVERTDINGNVIPLVVGIVSFGTFCSNGSFGVYTRVADFREWIESETETSMDYLSCISRVSGKRVVQALNIYETSRDLPFHRVKLLWNTSKQTIIQCGATMIDYQYAITSAFCVKDKQNPPMFIKVESTSETVEVDKAIIHPDFSSKHPENDLALLKLSKYLKGDKDLLPVCLKWKQDRNSFPGVTFSAYATKKLSGQLSNRQVVINAIGSECMVPNHTQSNLLCINNSISLVPTLCTMDYGGAVTKLAYNENYTLQAYYLEGVVSQLSKRCDVDLVGIRLSPTHIEWIESVVLEQQNDDRLIFL